MESPASVRVVPWEDLPETSLPAGDGIGVRRQAVELRRALLRTRTWLLEEQHADGHWVAELEGDSILQSEYLLLLAWLDELDTPLAAKLAQRLIDMQLPSGGWGMYPGAGLEISASVKAYFALKLCGHDASHEPLQRARRAIVAHGGADAVNSFTRFYLALLGQIPYELCPEVPPELVLLPRWFPVNLYAMSAWTRTIVVPLSIMSAFRPVREIDPRRGIRELFLSPPERWPALRAPGASDSMGARWWRRFFYAVDRGLKLARRWKLLPLRRRGLAAAERWMVERFGGSDGLGAIFPPMVWSVIALKCLGCADDSEELRYCRRTLDGLVIEEELRARLQPCKSPVWDTAIALRALSESGLDPARPAARRAVQWLLDRQVDRPGDWQVKSAAPPAGWCFEYENDFYPDVDDTAMVALALARQFQPAGEATLGGLDLAERGHVAEVVRLPIRGVQNKGDRSNFEEEIGPVPFISEALARAQAWMLALQNRDGGWGAFDRDNDRRFLCHVPFADHNAMIDPSTPDLTARVLEALGALGARTGSPAVDRAVRYLRRTQEADGSWYGRWGVNYIYGTWQVLTGLAAVGLPPSDAMPAAGVNWLLAHQQPCGGWGESADSYDQPALRGQGPTTPSQTAWAVLGLIAAGEAHHPATRRGVQWLLSTQRDDGRWDETEFTGTGFPRVFYLRYHYYPIYFPLLALARWAAVGARNAK